MSKKPQKLGVTFVTNNPGPLSWFSAGVPWGRTAVAQFSLSTRTVHSVESELWWDNSKFWLSGDTFGFDETELTANNIGLNK